MTPTAVSDKRFVAFEAERCSEHNLPLCTVTVHGGPKDGSTVRWCLTDDALGCLHAVLIECQANKPDTGGAL